MQRSPALRLAEVSIIIDHEVRRLLRQTMASTRRLERMGLHREAEAFRQTAITVVSAFVDDVIREARQSSAAVGRLLDEIEREGTAETA